MMRETIGTEKETEITEIEITEIEITENEITEIEITETEITETEITEIEITEIEITEIEKVTESWHGEGIEEIEIVMTGIETGKGTKIGIGIGTEIEETGTETGIERGRETETGIVKGTVISGTLIGIEIERGDMTDQTNLAEEDTTEVFQIEIGEISETEIETETEALKKEIEGEIIEKKKRNQNGLQKDQQAKMIELSLGALKRRQNKKVLNTQAKKNLEKKNQ